MKHVKKDSWMGATYFNDWNCGALDNCDVWTQSSGI